MTVEPPIGVPTEVASELAALRAEVALYRAALRVLPSSMVLFYDNDLRHVAAGGADLALSGSSTQQLVGQHARDSLPEPVYDHWFTAYEASLRGESVHGQLALGARPYISDVLPLRDETGAIIGGMALARALVADQAEAGQRDLYQAIVEQAPIAIAITNVQRRVSFVNRAEAGLCGVESPDDLIGAEAHHYLAPEERVQLQKEIPPTLMKHGFWQGIVRFRRQDGVAIFSEQITQLLFNRAGQSLGMVTYSKDITAQMAARQERERLLDELEMRERELRLFKELIERAPDGIAMGEENDVTIVYANAAYAAMTGLGDAAIGGPLARMYDSEGLAQIARESDPQMAREGFWTGQVPALRPDGTRWMSQQTCYTVRDPNRGQKQWVVFYRDITASEQAAAQVRESEALLRVVMENLPVVLAVIDMAGVCQLSAGRELQTLGLQPDDLVGRSVWQVFAEDEELLSNLRRAFAGETVEMLYTKKAVFDTIFVPFYDDDGKQAGIISIGTNVTERIRNQEEREQLQAQVIAAQEATLRELSTPLIPITDQVVVMPLVGSINSGRAQLVMETLLEGVASSRAEAVILDITGVPIVDTQVANALVHAAQALKLLGARVILTGIRPEVAQTLVGLGADLSVIEVHGSLQNAISAVLRRDRAPRSTANHLRERR